ncbi:GIY-YIG nuclease family protein [Nocardioides sp. Bht2]|uniref:GIY-YIG nuclease family protein n=1 Tax=Nocardioides sp. Bht2 TaxID=3392297 RepID=UPI0039B68F93
MNGYCYILECTDGSYYVGSTVDLERRISEHQLGLGAAYTRRRRPVRLVWYESFSRIDAAYAREKQIQNWGRAKRKALIEGRTADLRRLAQSYADRLGDE